MLVQEDLVVLPYQAGRRCAIKHHYASWMFRNAALLAYELGSELAPFLLLMLGHQLGNVLAAANLALVASDALEAFFLCRAFSETHVVAEPCALAWPLLVDALHDFLVIVVREVYVHVRQIVPERVEESCQRYALLDRIHVSDSKEITDQTAACAASGYVWYVSGKFKDVQHSDEVLGEVLLAYYLKLFS